MIQSWKTTKKICDDSAMNFNFFARFAILPEVKRAMKSEEVLALNWKHVQISIIIGNF